MQRQRASDDNLEEQNGGVAGRRAAMSGNWTAQGAVTRTSRTSERRRTGVEGTSRRWGLRFGGDVESWRRWPVETVFVGGGGLMGDGRTMFGLWCLREEKARKVEESESETKK
ncbi:hypothetical protein PIB30_070069, partial [Stylosanthes scabra]|nr:hypothetical protein [Stylosanthes scabra]